MCPRAPSCPVTTSRRPGRSAPFGIFANRLVDHENATLATTAAAAAVMMAIPPEPEHARAIYRRSRVRVAVLGSGEFVATCNWNRAAATSTAIPRLLHSCVRCHCPASHFTRCYAAISRSAVLLLGALFAAGKVLSRATVARIRMHWRDTHLKAPCARLTCDFSAIPAARLIRPTLISVRNCKASLLYFQIRMSSWQRRISFSRRPKPIS